MAHPPTHRNSDPLTLVLLDDSAASSRLTRERLDDARVTNTLTTVRTPDDLLAALEGEGENGSDRDRMPRPDVILLDTRLSTGYADDYLDGLVTHPAVASLPVVLLAATEREAEFVTATTDYSLPVLTKPLDPVELLDLLRAEEGVGLSFVKRASN